MKRSPMRQRYKPTGPDGLTVETLWARSDGRCELCGDPIRGDRGLDFSLHHRRGRDGRPDSHTPQNLLLVHGASNVAGCHGRIHRNREGESYASGWLLSRNAKPVPDPARFGVLIWQSRWVYLGDDGAYHDNPPERAS